MKNKQPVYIKKRLGDLPKGTKVKLISCGKRSYRAHWTITRTYPNGVRLYYASHIKYLSSDTIVLLPLEDDPILGS